MLKFIVLGLVPGTSYQISFDAYLLFFACLLTLSLISWYYIVFTVRRKAIRIATIQLISL